MKEGSYLFIPKRQNFYTTETLGTLRDTCFSIYYDVYQKTNDKIYQIPIYAFDCYNKVVCDEGFSIDYIATMIEYITTYKFLFVEENPDIYKHLTFAINLDIDDNIDIYNLQEMFDILQKINTICHFDGSSQYSKANYYVAEATIDHIGINGFDINNYMYIENKTKIASEIDLIPKSVNPVY